MPTPTLRALARYRFANCPAKKISLAKIHTTSSLRIQDSLKDRTKIDRESNEYSKSGSDDAAAATDTAFKPDESNPQEEMEKQQKQGDALNVSPGNHDISQPVKSNKGSPETSAPEGKGEQKSSGGGSPLKGKKIS